MNSSEENVFSLPVRQINGCRHFGPREELKNLTPPIGSEVFVARIPPNFSHRELIKIFTTAGLVYDVRVMLTFMKENKGYAFVRYLSPELALKAIKYINGNRYQDVSGKLCLRLVAMTSSDHRTLMLSGCAPGVTTKEVENVFQDIEQAELISVTEEFQRGRTSPVFYLLFASHRSAALTRKGKWKELIPQHWGKWIRLEWQHNDMVNQRAIYKLERKMQQNYLEQANLPSEIPLEIRGFPRSILASMNSQNTCEPLLNRPLPPTAANLEMNVFEPNFNNTEKENQEFPLRPERLLPTRGGFKLQHGISDIMLPEDLPGPSAPEQWNSGHDLQNQVGEIGSSLLEGAWGGAPAYAHKSAPTVPSELQQWSSGNVLQNQIGGIGSSLLEGAWGGAPAYAHMSAPTDENNFFLQDDTSQYPLFGRPIRGRGNNDQLSRTMRF